MVQNKKSGEASFLVICKFFLFISNFYQFLFGGDCCNHVFLAFVDPKVLQPVGDKKNSKTGLVVFKSFSFISNFYLIAIILAIAIVTLHLASC